MKKLSRILFVILLLSAPALAQTQAETYRANDLRLTSERKYSGKYNEALHDYEQSLKLDQQLKDILEKRIVLAKEKMQADENQPK
ncbi:MAG TPA: hypothetical protein VF604_17350 [Pyrinomonadaceae bacterium]